MHLFKPFVPEDLAVQAIFSQQIQDVVPNNDLIDHLGCWEVPFKLVYAFVGLNCDCNLFTGFLFISTLADGQKGNSTVGILSDPVCFDVVAHYRAFRMLCQLRTIRLTDPTNAVHLSQGRDGTGESLIGLLEFCDAIGPGWPALAEETPDCLATLCLLLKSIGIEVDRDPIEEMVGSGQIDYEMAFAYLGIRSIERQAEDRVKLRSHLHLLESFLDTGGGDMYDRSFAKASRRALFDIHDECPEAAVGLAVGLALVLAFIRPFKARAVTLAVIGDREKAGEYCSSIVGSYDRHLLKVSYFLTSTCNEPWLSGEDWRVLLRETVERVEPFASWVHKPKRQ